MKKIIFVLTCIIFVFPQIHAQKKQRIYYDKDWKVVKTKKEAEFYREVIKKSKSDTGGIVKDYFINGALQGEGNAIKLDMEDDANTIWKGKLTGYYAGAIKRFENNYNDSGIAHGTHTQWYINGFKESELNYSEGKLNGVSVSYFPNGKEKSRLEYNNGVLTGPVITCEEDGNCEKTVREDFKSGDDTMGWNLKMTKDEESEILAGQGLRMAKKTNKRHHRAVSWDLDMKKNFKIESSVLFSEGDNKNGFGLVFAYKDIGNLQFFYISAEGKFKTGVITNNKAKSSVWKTSEFINKGAEINDLKIVYSGKNLEFFINNSLVQQSEFNPVTGTLAGIGLEEGAGKMQAYLISMIVSNSLQ
ncbi:MAG: hypothetical protein ABI761_08325 [Saprospiraceae bacterium]